MKRTIIIVAALSVLMLATSFLYSRNRKNYQIAELYVCDSSLVTAELQAMTKVSRQDLYTVSYCNCLGFDSELQGEVRGECVPPRDTVYLCTCIGKSSY